MSDERIIESIESIRRALFFLIGKQLGKEGSGKEYSKLRKAGFSNKEIALMFGVTESGVASAISQAKSRGKTKKSSRPAKEGENG